MNKKKQVLQISFFYLILFLFVFPCIAYVINRLHVFYLESEASSEGDKPLILTGVYVTVGVALGVIILIVVIVLIILKKW